MLSFARLSPGDTVLERKYCTCMRISKLGVAFGSCYRDELVVRLGDIVDWYFCLQKGRERSRAVGRRGFLFVRYLVCFDDCRFWELFVSDPTSSVGLFVGDCGPYSIV